MKLTHKHIHANKTNYQLLVYFININTNNKQYFIAAEHLACQISPK